MLHRINLFLQEVDKNKSAGEFRTRHERVIICERSLTATEFQELCIPFARKLTGTPSPAAASTEVEPGNRSNRLHTYMTNKARAEPRTQNSEPPSSEAPNPTRNS